MKTHKALKRFNPVPLHNARLLAGWSYKTLATAANLNYHTCVATMHGKWAFPPTVEKIARALRVPIEQVWR